MTTKTERFFPILRSAGATPVLTILVLAAFLLGCSGAEEGGSRLVHFVEVANPTEVAARHGEEGLEDLLDRLVRPEEMTYVLVANHEDGYMTRFPADMWFWNRWDRLSALTDQIRKAAAATTTTDKYRRKLHQLSRKVYGETERPVLVRNTVLGGWSGLKKCAGTEGPGTAETGKVKIPGPDLGTPASWGTILGSWLWLLGLITGLIVVGYGWHRLGEKAQNRDC